MTGLHTLRADVATYLDMARSASQPSVKPEYPFPAIDDAFVAARSVVGETGKIGHVVSGGLERNLDLLVRRIAL